MDVSNKINYFNIAVPAGHYQKFSITFTATDGKQCVMTGGNFEIKHNTVGTLSLTGKEFKAGVPADALPGVFTVADDGQGNVKKVHFSKGNLYYDGSNWGFEKEQYYFRTYDGKDKCDAGGYSWGSGTASGHWGLFGWSTEGKNFGMSTSTSTGDYSGKFLDWGTAIDSKGTWSTLTGGDNGEWKYLFDHHVNVWGMCNEVMYGRFIAPDGFEGDASALSNAINDWESAQAAGIVFLPACGYRNGNIVDQVEQHGYYWSSTTDSDERVYYVSFLSNQANFSSPDYRNLGISVRLVTESK